jgi:hypothetical protein
LEAGAAHGIAISAEFMAYSDPDKLLNPLGTFVVKRLWPFESDMRLLASSSIFPSQGASAIQTKAGKVKPFRLYIPPENDFLRQYHSIRASNAADLQDVILVNNPEDAHLEVFTSLPDDRLTFMHTDKRVTQHGMNFVTDGVKSDPDIVGGILETAARYFRELNRTIADSHDIADLIEVEFYKLDAPKTRAAGRPILEVLKPVGPNLCRNKVIDFVVEDSEKSPHGFKIINKSADNFYVNAFYFDNTDFKIREFHCGLLSART